MSSRDFGLGTSLGTSGGGFLDLDFSSLIVTLLLVFFGEMTGSVLMLSNVVISYAFGTHQNVYTYSLRGLCAQGVQ